MGDPSPDSSYNKVVDNRVRFQDAQKAKIIEPLRRQERLLLARAEETNTFIPKGQNHLLEALTSEHFKVRVDAGINRLRLHNAESGIGILSDGTEIVFPSIDLGAPQPRTLGEIAMTGIDTAHVPMNFRTSAKWNKTHDAHKYKVTASFHFHLRSAVVFSQTDLEIYDGAADRSTPYVYKYKPNHTYGLFLPQWGSLAKEELIEGLPPMEQQITLSALKLFMFSGPPSDTYYQAQNFNMLSLEKQAEVLKESGMKVIIVNLPVANDSVNLTPLKGVLENS